MLRARELQRLHDWYRKEHRRLPFRKTRDFYKVWVSETMLQQTRVAAMLPLYEKFIKRFPDLDSLARASEDEVLAHWQGLGYYRRARNLLAGAKRIIKEHQGEFPGDYSEALKIEGIGPYTAAAVLSICFQKRIAVLDGNVRRVLSRLFCTSDLSEAAFRERAQELLSIRPRIDPGLHNQAMMELGATLCKTTDPACHVCPLRRACLAYKKGGTALATAILPQKKQKKIDVRLEVYVFKNDYEYLLCRQKDSYFFKDLWFFPYRLFQADRLLFASEGLEEWESAFSQASPLRTSDRDLFSEAQKHVQRFKHHITKHRISGEVHFIGLHEKKEPDFRLLPSTKLAKWKWVAKEELGRHVVSSILGKIQFL